MQAVPILFVAPTPTMAQMVRRVARDLGIEIAVETARDEDSLEIIQRYADSIEVVVSRGGIAQIIAGVVSDDVSVIEVTLSLQDLLGIVSSLSQQGISRIGVVSRANLFDGLTGDFRIGATTIAFRACADEAGIAQAIADLREQGIEAVIGCRQAYHFALECNIAAVFLESNAISIRTALEEALRLVRARRHEKLQAVQLGAIIDNVGEGILAIDNDREVRFHNSAARRIFATQPGFDAITRMLGQGVGEQIATIQDNSYVVRIIPLEVAGERRGEVITLQAVSQIQASETRIRISAHRRGLRAKASFDDIVGCSDALAATIQKAKTYAAYDANLLIHGETGTGKEIFAQSVHNHSPRREGPFVSVNTASIPASLLESELFGYAEGAFTGARKGGKPGLFELAHGGTLFLDEIGELAPEIQSRLLRVLQEKEIMRIGDDKIVPVDVRIICATHRDLFEQVRKGLFREDLYYRIHVLSLHLPPLRERRDDIVPLFLHFLSGFPGVDAKGCSLEREARDLLHGYAWPGNVRQLHNVAEVLAYFKLARIEARHIVEVLDQQSGALGPDSRLTIPDTGTLKQMEGHIIRGLLARHSQDEVCRRLGVSRVTLWRKLKAQADADA
ncbi:sigma 54-interacting transcriptional regulator [Uliginosibacterium sp. sgz301328]